MALEIQSTLRDIGGFNTEIYQLEIARSKFTIYSLENSTEDTVGKAREALGYYLTDNELLKYNGETVVEYNKRIYFCMSESHDCVHPLESKDELDKARTLFEVAQVYRYLKMFDAVKAFCHKSLDVLPNDNTCAEVKSLKCRIYLHLGQIYLIYSKHYPLAKEYCQKSLEIAEEMNNTQNQAIAYSRLGHIHLAQDKPKEAVHSFEKSNELLKNIAGYDLLIQETNEGLEKALNSQLKKNQKRKLVELLIREDVKGFVGEFLDEVMPMDLN